MGLFEKLRDGLSKTRSGITGRIDSMLASFGKIDEELFEELEEILIFADVGVETTDRIIEGLKEKVRENGISDPLDIKKLLKQQIAEILDDEKQVLDIGRAPAVIVVLGVNGAGKTTTIGKLANILKKRGLKPIIAAADTFRAAATEQLEIWAKKVGVDMIGNREGSDPASVVYDAIHAAKSRNSDIIICDTAGRLHTKRNLMEELRKILRIIRRELPDSSIETLLVLDATTGQNAVSQARTFKEAVDVSGIVLTKLDGTAKGGIVIAIRAMLGIPVKFVGVGEQLDDLQEFNSEDFADALFNDNR